MRTKSRNERWHAERRGKKGKANGMKSKLFFSFSLPPLFFHHRGTPRIEWLENTESESRNSGNENRGKKKEEKKRHESRGQRNVSHRSPFFSFFFFFFPPFFPQLEKARYVTTRGIRARVYFTFHQWASNTRVTRLERGNGACTCLRTGCGSITSHKDANTRLPLEMREVSSIPLSPRHLSIAVKTASLS